MLPPVVRQGLALAGLGLALASLAACRDRGLQSCRELAESGRNEEAAGHCEGVFVEQGDPEAGVLAARAHYLLGHRDRVLAWADRLKGTSGEAGVLPLAGLVHQQQGETDLAIQACQRGLALARAGGDHAGAATAFYGLFYISWYGSQYREGLDYARQCYEEAERAGDRPRQATAAEALYTILHTIGDREAARRALDRAEELLPADRRLERARVLANRGNLLIDDGRLELARRDIERALELAAGSARPLFLRSAHLNLVEIALRRRELDVAERHLAEVAKHIEAGGQGSTGVLYYRARLAREHGRLDEAQRWLRTALDEQPVPEWQWELEKEQGRVAEARGDLRAAAAAYGRAADIVEEMRAELGLDNAKDALVETRREPFEALFRLQAQAGDSEGALATAERVKARTFQDAFLHALTTSQTDPGEAWKAAADRLAALQDLLPAMSESPAASPRPVRQILAALRGRLALVYFAAGEELWLLRVADKEVRLHRLAASPAKAGDLARRFAANPDDPQIATALGDLLLPPGTLPPAGSTLHVAADGGLGRIPFAALRLSELGGRCLLEDHSVAYIPGVSALAEIGARPGRSLGAPVVLADPRGDLPAARAEAGEVAARLGCPVRTGGAATARALAAAADARVLHLATHTGLGPGGPWLALADRRLTASAVLAGRLRPRLAVLATCASAAPASQGTWGSLGSAFLAAGSEAVLASLWSVEDRTAREVVLRFYAEGGTDDPVAALARAQRAFLRAGRPPSFWAPFVLLGADPAAR
jgi:CHAT domain-containing protein